MSIREAWNLRFNVPRLPIFASMTSDTVQHPTSLWGGASLAEIAEVLGHKTLQMTKRYTHLTESHTRGVVERMNQAIFR